MGLLHPKTKLQKLSALANAILKSNLLDCLDCLIKQSIRFIVFKYFLRENYYCSIIAMIPTRRKGIPNMNSIMVLKFPKWFIVKIYINLLCSTMSLSKITGMDILTAKLMALVTVPWKLKHRFGWIIKNCRTLEKPCTIMAGYRDEQYYRKKNCLLKDVLVFKINLKKTALCLLPKAERWQKNLHCQYPVGKTNSV